MHDKLTRVGVYGKNFIPNQKLDSFV